MDVEILGPVTLRCEGRDVPLLSTRRRSVLIALLLEANRPVSIEHLLSAVGGRPERPEDAPGIRSQITHLRRALGPGRLRRVGDGYQLAVEPGELDAESFRREVERSGQAAARGDDTTAAEELERALARWRGPALAGDRHFPAADAEARSLEALRSVARQALLDARLALGRHPEVIEDAGVLLAETPDSEAACACLMLALHRSGRTAEAVRAFQGLQAALRADGRSPSHELDALERSILHRDPALLAEGGLRRPAGSRPAPAAPTLPGGVVTFLMTDVVGSTRMWEAAPTAMRAAMARHDELVLAAVESHGGVLVRERGEGDSTFSVFQRATDAAAAALAARLSLDEEPWPPRCAVRLRMALHTGEASQRDGDYYGRIVNRVARLRAIAEPGQILVGQSAAEILFDHLPDQASLRPLGVKELRDFDRPETVYVLGTTTAPAADPPPGAAGRGEPAPAIELVIEADEEFYACGGAKEVPFPGGGDPQVMALGREAVLLGRRRSDEAGCPSGARLEPPHDDPGVSRVHALIERREDGALTLIDPGSMNGTFVNDMVRPVAPRVPVRLAAGDRIYAGLWTRIRIRAVDPAPERHDRHGRGVAGETDRRP